MKRCSVRTSSPTMPKGFNPKKTRIESNISYYENKLNYLALNHVIESLIWHIKQWFWWRTYQSIGLIIEFFLIPYSYHWKSSLHNSIFRKSIHLLNDSMKAMNNNFNSGWNLYLIYFSNHFINISNYKLS